MHRRMPDDSQVEIPKKYMLGLYAVLLAIGIIIYLSWGLLYGSWNVFARENLGMYAVTTILCGFGFFGLVLYSIKGNE